MTVTLWALPGLPEIRPGDDLPDRILNSLRACGEALHEGDVLVVAQKVVSKAEGMLRDLRSVVPGERALDLARRLNADAATVQVILDESVRIVREDRVLIVETHHGFVCANAGVDHSNIPGDSMVSVLPRDCDASARHLRDAIEQRTGVALGVVVSDTFGRPWRVGVVNVALGVAGIPAMTDLRGTTDATEKQLTSTVIATADEIAAAAELVMGKTTRTPVVVVRGLVLSGKPGTGSELIRDAVLDLFR